MLPKPLGHYAQIVRAGELFFLSGQIALDSPNADVTQQAEQIFKNVEAILVSEGLTKENIVKTTIYLTDLAQFARVNEVYAQFFGPHKPARATVGVAALPKGAAIEIEAVAFAGPLTKNKTGTTLRPS